MKKFLLTLVACVVALAANAWTVYFTNPDNWDSVAVWVWNGSTNYTGGKWPGKPMTKGSNGIWSYNDNSLSDLPSGTQIIFNNNINNGSQTGDLKFENGATYNKYGPLGADLNEYSIYYDNSDTNWQNVYLYAWDGVATSTYPGDKVTTKNEQGYYVFTFQAENEPSGAKCIWNDGTDSNKTGNLDLVVGAVYNKNGIINSDGSNNYPSQMYVIGQVNNIDWNPTEGVPMEVVEDGIYSITGIQLNGHFAFTSQLSTSGSDWNTCNSNRYGPPTNDSEAAIGSNTVQKVANSWALPSSGGGLYDITLNLNDNSMTLSKSNVAPTYPDELYVIGTLQGNVWKPNAGVKMSKTDEGKFEVSDVILVDNDGNGANFSFCTQLAENDNGWGAIGNRYGANTQSNTSVKIQSGKNYDLYQANDPGAFSGTQGTYTISVDLTTMSMTASWVELPDTDYPTTLYVIGDVNNGTWGPSNGVAMTPGENGVFTVSNIALGSYAGKAYFSFTESLAANWNEMDQRYGATTNGTLAYVSDSDNIYTIQKSNNNAFYVPAGTYNLTVNFADKTLQVELININNNPLSLYLVGDNVNGDNTFEENTTKYPLTYDAETMTYNWSGELLGTNFKINDGSWNGNYNIGVSDSQTITLGEPLQVTNDGSSKNITFSGVSMIQKPSLSLDVSNMLLTVTGYEPLYLRGAMTEPVAWEINPSYMFDVSTNENGQTVYTLTVASFPGQSDFKFADENYTQEWTNGENDLQANLDTSYTLTKQSTNMQMSSSWLNITFTLTIDKDDSTQAHLMITGEEDNSSDWVVTFGNDKTMQSGEVIDNVYTISVLQEGYYGVLYVYAPEAADKVYYKTESDTEASSYMLEGYKEARENADGAYPISVIGTGTLSLYYVDTDGSESTPTSYKYSVKVSVPTAVGEIGIEEDGEAVYYNLQGVRVDNPSHGIFVKVVNGKAVKEVLK